MGQRASGTAGTDQLHAAEHGTVGFSSSRITGWQTTGAQRARGRPTPRALPSPPSDRPPGLSAAASDARRLLCPLAGTRTGIIGATRVIFTADSCALTCAYAKVPAQRLMPSGSSPPSDTIFSASDQQRCGQGPLWLVLRGHGAASGPGGARASIPHISAGRSRTGRTDPPRVVPCGDSAIPQAFPSPASTPAPSRAANAACKSCGASHAASTEEAFPLSEAPSSSAGQSTWLASSGQTAGCPDAAACRGAPAPCFLRDRPNRYSSNRVNAKPGGGGCQDGSGRLRVRKLYR